MNMNCSIREAEELLRKEGCSEEVIAHSRSVCEYATLIASRAQADVQLVSCAAMLHDIGRSRTHGISHGVVGADILRGHGIEEKIVCAVEKHVGAGIDSQEAERLGLPVQDYLPYTLEEKIVCMADSLVLGERIITFEELLSCYKKLGLDSSIKRFKEMYGELQRWL
jgi:uncharacterized protein (TIGR00295 family)